MSGCCDRTELRLLGMPICEGGGQYDGHARRTVVVGCLAVDYEAVGADGLQPVEDTVITTEALYVAHSEKPGVDVFVKADDGVFDGPTGGSYAQRLVIGWDGTTLTWSWHWGPSGATPTEKSRALVHLVES
jgi:hypothetical protein